MPASVASRGRNFVVCLIVLSLLVTMLPVPTARAEAPAGVVPAAIAGGSGFAVALGADGTVWTWGYAASTGLGRGTFTSSPADPYPLRIPTLDHVTAVAAGGSVAAALRDDGTVWQWGDSISGAPRQKWGLTDVRAIAAGRNYFLAAKSNGTLWAWGQNDAGQLGIGGTLPANEPVQVRDLTNVVAVAANQVTSYAITADGSVWSWGGSGSGRLGTGPDRADATRPVRITGLPTPIRQVVPGPFHVLAVAEDGHVWAWGLGNSDELGAGGLSESWTPVAVDGIDGVTAVAAPTGQSFALRTDGTVWRWGDTGVDNLSSPVPEQVTGLPGVTALSAGYGSIYAVGADNRLYAWGDGSRGQLGDGLKQSHLLPTPVLPLYDDHQPPTWGAGAAVTVTELTDRTAYLTWNGATDDVAVLSYRVTGVGASPFPSEGDGLSLVGLDPGTTYTAVVQAVDPAGNVSVDGPAVTFTTKADTLPPTWPSGLQLTPHNPRPDGVTLMWGWATDNAGVDAYTVSRDGEELAVLDGDTHSYEAEGLSPGRNYTFAVKARDAAGNWSDALTASVITMPEGTGTRMVARPSGGLLVAPNGTLWYWGSLAAPGLTQTSMVSPYDGPTGVVDVTADQNRTVYLRADGTAWEMSPNAGPTPLPGFDGAVALAGGAKHILALMPDGTVRGYGSNADGQLGLADPQAGAQVVTVPNLTGVKAIAAGDSTSLAVKADGTVWTWGVTLSGTATRTSTPVKVDKISKVSAVSMLSDHVLALDAQGQVWAWGDNACGQLGDGTTKASRAPVRVLANATAVSAGVGYSLAMTADGSVFHWGCMEGGSDGYGSIPGIRPGIPPAIAVAASDHLGIALTDRGNVFTWGDGRYAAMGRWGTAWVPASIGLPWTDYQPPHFPSGSALAVTVVPESGVDLAWTAARDNEESVAQYRIYDTGTLLATVPGDVLTVRLKNLSRVGGHSFQVAAVDPSGNESTDGPSRSMKMPPGDEKPPVLLRYRNGTPVLHVAVYKDGQWELLDPSKVSLTTLQFRPDIGEAYALIGLADEDLGAVWVNGQQVAAKSVPLGSLLQHAAPPEASAGGAAPGRPAAASLAATLATAGLIDANYFEVILPPSINVSDKFTIRASDYFSNEGVLGTAEVYYQWGPGVTLTDPKAATLFVGAGGQLTVKGTTSAAFTALTAVDEATGAPVPLTLVSQQAKAFTATLTLDGQTAATYRIRLRATDAAGNPGRPDPRDADSRTVVVDPVAPAAPQLMAPDFAWNDSLVTNQTTVTLSGTAEPLATVEVSAAGRTTAVTANPKGEFTLRVGVVVGANPVSLTAIDRAGNRSEALVRTIIVDKTGPVLKNGRLSASERGAYFPGQVVGSRFYAAVNQAGTYLLELGFDETVSSVRIVERRDAHPEPMGNAVLYTLDLVKEGTTTVTFEVKDLVGNTTRYPVSLSLDTQGPQLTLSGSARSWLVGAPAADGRQTVTISGTANERLSDVLLLKAGAQAGADIQAAVTIDPRDGRKWSATVSVPATEPASWGFQFAGIDLAGNVSATPTPALRILVDPDLPQLTLQNDVQGVLFTGLNNDAALVTKGRLTVAGTVTDDRSGVKQVMVGTTKVTSKQPQQSLAFRTTVTLTEGKLTTVTVCGEDMAGNKSAVATIRAILKTKVTLSASATWSSKTKSLLVNGTTDKAIRVDEAWVAAVPVSIQVKQGEKEIYAGRLELGSEGYDPAKGTFTLTLPGTTWSPGSYTVTVTALPPAEFPTLAPVVKTLKVTIK